jgi:hypothetical protein
MAKAYAGTFLCLPQTPSSDCVAANQVAPLSIAEETSDIAEVKEAVTAKKPVRITQRRLNAVFIARMPSWFQFLLLVATSPILKMN